LFLYIQGNFIPRNYGVLNGVAIDWEKYIHYKIASIILLVFAILLGIFLGYIKENAYKFGYYASLFIILIQLITISFLFIQKNLLAEKSIYIKDFVVTDKDIFNLSKSKNNIVIFILDSFDSAQLLNFIESDTGKQYTEVLEDFTYYPDTLSSYPTTKGALPHILTGVKYQNEQPYTEYIQEAYSDNKIYELLEKQEYSVGVYAQAMYLSDSYDYINVTQGSYSIGDWKKFESMIYKLVAFNYMPHQLKKFFWINTDDFDQLKRIPSGDHSYSHEMQKVNETLLRQGISVGNAKKCFRIYYTDGTHPPYTFGTDLVSSADVIYTVEDEVAGNLSFLKSFLQELKNKDIYDNTAIIVLADHGQYNLCQNPLFMMKNISEKHEFIISNQEMSFEFLPNIFEAIISGKNVDEKYIENCLKTAGKRSFMYYSWDNSWNKQYLPPILEMECEGNANNPDNLTTIKEYPGAPLE